jgi:hypothetical protein
MIKEPKIKQGIYLGDKQYKKLMEFQYRNNMNGRKMTYSSIINDLIETHL